MFRWLCISSGWTPAEIALRITEPVDRIQMWCEGTESPSLTINNLEKLSDAFKRPLTAFLLPSPPEDEILPKDFRKIPDPTGSFSKDTLRMIRKARRELELWRELAENIGESVPVTLPRYSLYDNPENIARIERERLNVSHVLTWKDTYTAYRYWRELLSSLHILVLQLKMPIEEARGFSITLADSAAVIVNGRDTPHARIFTLFHEYAHLLLDESAVCDNQSDSSSNPHIRLVESWCNTFAGAFLLPKEELENHHKIESFLQSGDYVNAAAAISSHFRVSKDAALIRLRVLNLISEEELCKSRSFFQGISVNFNEKETLTAHEKKIVIDPVAQCVSEKGPQFISLVFKNENAGLITYRDVIDYLDLKSKHIDKLKQR